jgi:hypothetical protein
VIPLIVVVLLANQYRHEIFWLDLPVRVFTAIVLLILGWRLARDIGRTLAPGLFKRMDPATAGTVGVEEIDSDEIVVRIAATPAAESDGRRLADEILAAIAPITREGLTE